VAMPRAAGRFFHTSSGSKPCLAGRPPCRHFLPQWSESTQQDARPESKEYPAATTDTRHDSSRQSANCEMSWLRPASLFVVRECCSRAKRDTMTSSEVGGRLGLEPATFGSYNRLYHLSTPTTAPTAYSVYANFRDARKVCGPFDLGPARRFSELSAGALLFSVLDFKKPEWLHPLCPRKLLRHSVSSASELLRIVSFRGSRLHARAVNLKTLGGLLPGRDLGGVLHGTGPAWGT